MSNYSVLIVDDEVNNISILEHFIEKYCPEVSVVGCATSIADAILAINQIKPAILFLDIKLNEGDAFDILDQLIYTNYQIIFVTSYNEYAIKAFKYDAINYILKPLSVEEVMASISKAIKNIRSKQFFDVSKLASHLITQSRLNNPSQYLAIPAMDKVDIVRLDDIVYIEAEGKYTVIRSKEGGKYTSSKNILYFEQSIDDLNFFRIHHSYIINIAYLEKVIKNDGGYCEMSSGILLPISRRRLDDFNRFIKIKG